MQVVALQTSQDKSQQGVISLLEAWLEKARKGDLQALVLLGETASGYQYARVGLPIEKAVGLHMRAVHNLQRDWDGI